MKNLIYIIFVSYMLNSCVKKETIIINDVTKSKVYKYRILKSKNYTKYFIEITGYVDDTIIIQNHCKLFKEIDTTLNFDYYGGDAFIELNYNAYKAKKGFLKISHYAN